jgi:septal ring factor EnvC (AmiA/AmiB activator)
MMKKISPSLKLFVPAVLLLAGSSLMCLSVGCAKRPNKQEMTALDEASTAAKSAEQKLEEVKKERAALERELESKKEELRGLEEQRDAIKTKLQGGQQGGQ